MMGRNDQHAGAWLNLSGLGIAGDTPAYCSPP